MARKWTLTDLALGTVAEATMWNNPVADSGFRWRTTQLDGRRTPKVVLSDDARIIPGVPCLVRVTAIKKPERDDRGIIEVEWVSPAPFRLEGVYLDPAVSKKLQVALDSGLNILLDGPQGCGKTVLARSIADSLGMEFVFFNCGAVVEATDFFATIQVRASSTGAPVTDFVKTDVLIALEHASEHPEKRYLVFLDELNRCQETARNALMPALDSTRRVFHPIENTFIPITDNVQFVAAVNRGREFSATFGIDAAQLDRFAPLQMTYLPPVEEEKLLAKRHPDLTKAAIGHVVAVAHAIRRSPELGGTLSVRATDEACIFLEHPLYGGNASDDTTWTWDDPTSDAGVVWGVVSRVLAERKVSAPS